MVPVDDSCCACVHVDLGNIVRNDHPLVPPISRARIGRTASPAHGHGDGGKAPIIIARMLALAVEDGIRTQPIKMYQRY